MRVWVEAYGADGRQLLGNGEGQGPIHAKKYRRTDHYKNLVGWLRTNRYPRVFTYHIRDDHNLVLETLRRDDYV